MRRRSAGILTAALLSTCIGVPALAQDVLVMRRVVAQPAPALGWSVGDWAWADTDTCTANARQTRDVHCAGLGGSVAADSACKTPKPDAERTTARLDGCTSSWTEGSWGAWSSSCSTSAVRTRTVTCVRQDGSGGTTPVDDASCGSGRPDATQTGTVSTGCTFDWDAGGWGQYSIGCGQATRTRTVTCRSTNGDAPGSSADDAQCSAATRPTDAETALNYANCTYSWTAVPGACSATSGYRQISSTCQRSGGATVATTVDASMCDPATTPSATRADASCTPVYAWAASTWSAYSGNCSTAATQTRTAWCQKTLDGVSTTAPDASCSSAGAKPATSQTVSSLDTCSNLLPNPGFEANTSDWTYSSGARSTAAARTGTYGLYLTQGSGGRGMSSATNAAPSLAEGRATTVGFWAQCVGGGTCTVSIKLVGNPLTGVTVKGSGWNYYTLSQSAVNVGGWGGQVAFSGTAYTGGYVYVDDIVVIQPN